MIYLSGELMNKYYQMVQTICLIFIVLLLAVIAWELRYSYFATPASYDPFNENKMTPPVRIFIDNLLHKGTNFTNTKWDDLPLPK